VPRTALFGRESYRFLNHFVFTYLLFSFLGLGVGVVWIAQEGIRGLAMAMIAIFIIRNAISYAYLFVARYNRIKGAINGMKTANL